MANSKMTEESQITTRRALLIGAAHFAGGVGLVSIVTPAHATPASMLTAIKKVVGPAPLRTGKVTIDIPPLVENGNTVPMVVTVESPMTATNYVKAIYVFNEKNPQPEVIGVRLGPSAGKAAFSTRIKLADSQKIMAIAQLSDGTFWSDSIDVIVTIAACLEEAVP